VHSLRALANMGTSWASLRSSAHGSRAARDHCISQLRSSYLRHPFLQMTVARTGLSERPAGRARTSSTRAPPWLLVKIAFTQPDTLSKQSTRNLVNYSRRAAERSCREVYALSLPNSELIFPLDRIGLILFLRRGNENLLPICPCFPSALPPQSSLKRNRRSRGHS